ncbi:MAG: DMT family transporter, partial [Burkholderiaceae bacterium]
MNSSRKALDGLAVGTMLILCLCWGLQQVAVKAAAPAVHPVLQIGLRSGLAALMVAVLMAVRGQRVWFSDGSLWPGVVAGLLFAAEFLCVALALLYTTASHVSVFLYTAPIFLVLVLHWRLPDERIDARQWAGVLLAFAGIALAFVEGFTQGDVSWRMLAGDALALAGGVLWAATTLVVRT